MRKRWLAVFRRHTEVRLTLLTVALGLGLFAAACAADAPASKEIQLKLTTVVDFGKIRARALALSLRDAMRRAVWWWAPASRTSTTPASGATASPCSSSFGHPPERTPSPPSRSQAHARRRRVHVRHGRKTLRRQSCQGSHLALLEPGHAGVGRVHRDQGRHSGIERRHDARRLRSAEVRGRSRDVQRPVRSGATREGTVL